MPTGCHRAGQGLLLHDGTIKAVEDVQVGDRLMGPDSRPRMVLALARGTGAMTEIRPVKGTPWVVNDEHIVTLVETQETGHGRYPSQRGGTIRDVALPDWWQWSKNRKHRHKLFRVPVDFPEREAPPLDPYFLGIVLGDSTLATPYRLSVTTIDPEVIDAITQAAHSFGLKIRDEGIQRHIHGRVARNANPIVGILRRLGLRPIACGDRFLPDAYRLGSRETRLAVLAGLLDSDGSYRDGGYEFASKSERLANDVVFVARSLGLAAYTTKRPSGHYRVSISGDCSVIPCRIPRKQAPARVPKKDVLRTGFQVIPTGTVEPYYGFTLSGDGRYLLDDFTITHNTGKTVCFAHLIDRRPGRALVIAHRDELIQQAAGKLRQVAPTLEVGIVKAEQDQTAADVVVASVQTLARPSRLARLDRDFTTVIVDEAHHAAAKTYVAALKHLGVFDDGGPLCVGFTATPERADSRQLGAVWEEIVYQRGILEMIAAGYLCDLRGQMVGTDADLARLKVRHGDLQDAEIAEELLRSGAIGQVAGAYVKHAPDRKGLAFTPTVETAYALAEALVERGIRAEALDGTTPRDQRRAILARLATGETRVVVNCLDAETEILTEQGWVGAERITEGDAVTRPGWTATLALDTGRLEWQPITHIVKRQREPGERMVCITNQTLDMRVTEGHRMIVRAAGADAWSVVEAGTLPSRVGAYELPLAAEYRFAGVALADAELEFLGLFATDGSLNRERASIEISQAATSPVCAEIERIPHRLQLRLEGERAPGQEWLGCGQHPSALPHPQGHDRRPTR